MKVKTLKIIAISVSSVLAVLLAAVMIIPSMFKDEITQTALKVANDNLNARVEIRELDFSLLSSFPHFTLSAEDFALHGTGEFEGTTLASAHQAYAVIDIMSVFSGTPKILRVGLEDPTINVVVKPSGAANYDIVKSSPSDTEAEEKDSTASAGFNIDLSRYEIANASIHYTDSTSMMALHIGGLNHSGSGAMRSQRFALATSTTIDTLTFEMDGTRYVKNAYISGDITMDMDMDNMKFAVDTQGKDYNLSLNGIPLLCSGSIALMENSAMELDLHLGSGQTSFSQLLSMIPPAYSEALDGVKTNGTFEMDGTIKGVYAPDNFPAVDIKLLAKDGMIKYPSLPKSIDDIQIDIHVSSPQSHSLDAMEINISRCDMKVAGSPLKASAYLRSLISDPAIRASLVTKLDISSLRDVMPLEKEDKVQGTIDANVSIDGRMSQLEKGQYTQFKADGSISILDMIFSTSAISEALEIPSAQLVFSPKALELRSFDVKLGGSDISLRGDLQNYLGYLLKDQTMKGTLNVSSSYIDLASLMPETQASETSAEAPKEEEKNETTSPISLPKGIDFATTLDMKKISYGGIVLEDVAGSLGLKNQIAYLNKVRTKIAGGSAVISGSYNAVKPENAKADMSFQLNGLDIASTVNMFESVKKIAPVAGDLTGKINGNMTLKTAFDANMEPIYSTMNSRGEISTVGLKMSNSKMMNTLGTTLGIKALQGDPQIKDVNMSYTISDGLLTVAPTSMDIAGITAKLSGDMKMDGFEMDMFCDMAIPRSMLSADINKTIDSALGALSSIGVKTSMEENIEIAGVITGPASSPKYSIAYGEEHHTSIGDYVAAEVKKAAAAGAEKAKESVKEKAGGFLKNLFGKKDKKE